MQNIAFAVVLVISAAGNAFAQQSPLPSPTGPRAVGRMIFNWVDESRVDLLSPKGYRELPVWVWYPATAASDAVKTAWLPGLWGDLLAAAIAPGPTPGAPSSEPYPVNTIRSHAYADAPLLAGQSKHPVILLAPGYGSGPGEYATLIEDLVSRGYVVAGFVPTYFSLFTVFSDGRVVGQFRNAGDVAGVPRAVSSRPDTLEPAFRLWVGDLRFTLNQLERLNMDAGSPFRGRLDLARVGAIGHSFGGTAVSQWAKEDSRVRALITIDGSQMGDVARDRSIPAPLLIVQSAMFQDRMARNPELRSRTLALLRSGKPGYLMTIAGAPHSFASDMGVMPFFTGWPPIMNTRPARALDIARAYFAAFLDQHLLETSSVLLNGQSSDYPEVTFETKLEE
jgi:predicted dienelactone hydrolase